MGIYGTSKVSLAKLAKFRIFVFFFWGGGCGSYTARRLHRTSGSVLSSLGLRGVLGLGLIDYRFDRVFKS